MGVERKDVSSTPHLSTSRLREFLLVTSIASVRHGFWDHASADLSAGAGGPASWADGQTQRTQAP